MAQAKNITVLAFKDEPSHGAEVEVPYCQTVAEAKSRAKYYLSRDYMFATGARAQLQYAQVLVDGKVEFDTRGAGK